MFFDDRLATVLRQPATGDAAARTQYRQLLDILGDGRARAGRRQDASLLAAAWLRLEALAETIPASTRAAMIREPGWRLRSPELVANLAEQEPEVASAALLRADLSGEDWAALIPHLPVRARAFVRERSDLPVDAENILARLGVLNRGLPAPAQASEAAAPPPERRAPPTLATAADTIVPAAAAMPPAVIVHGFDPDERGRNEISALVERIANFTPRRLDPGTESERLPQLPLLDLAEERERPVGVFGFATDVSGRIAWAEAEVASMVIGVRLIGQASPGDQDIPTGLARAFARRQPIVAMPSELAGATAIAGSWVVDAHPRFSEEGHFMGYIGRFRRAPQRSASNIRPEAREADHIRQLLHELRTPVQTMQGYGEMIQQQLRGPVPHEYRALASAISADAALILAGFDELDRFARIETGALSLAPGVADVARLARDIAGQLNEAIAPRGSRIALSRAAQTAELAVPIDAEEAEAMLWRVLATLAAHAAPDETLTLSCEPRPATPGDPGAHAGAAQISCSLPKALAKAENLFAITTRPMDKTINSGMFGAGFALRLARSEARAAGGGLVRDEGLVVLRLPLAQEVMLAAHG